MTGRRPGSVTCQSRRQRPAPSAAAASYSVGSMVESAARKDDRAPADVLPHRLGGHQHDERVGVGHDVPRLEAVASQLLGEQPGAAEHLHEERDRRAPS